MIEVELKIPISEIASMISRLTELGFVYESTVLEEDRYYDNSINQIVKAHQALRIRKVENLETGEVFYQMNLKDRKLDTVSVTRPEYETEIADAAALEQILNGLGFYAVEPYVRKKRQSYALGQVTACLDEVEGLGPFLELEKVIEEDEDREAALAELARLLDQLGLKLADTTRKSYLSQLREKLSRE